MLVWLVLSLAVIIGIVALTLDGGSLLEERRQVQAAADAAALAAAGDLYAHYWTNHGADPQGTARIAAQNSAAANGLPASAVTVNVPPQSGSFAGQAGYVEVIGNTSLDVSFGNAITGQPMQVAARAVAQGLPLKIGLLLLRGNGADAFLNKAVAFTVVNRPVVVNSTDPRAFDQSSLGVLWASRYDVTGGYVNSGGALVLGTVRTGVRPTLDPLAFLPIPDSSSAIVRSSVPLTINSLLPTTLLPGVYQGGIHVTGLSAVTMQPGVYIMEGGGFQIDGAATVAGQEVMVYNTISSSYSTGTVAISSTGKVALTAPMSGTYQGINVFQNRSLSQPISLTGFGLAAITGVIYGVRAPVNLTGNAAVGLDILGGAFVVDSMIVQGAGTINVNLGTNSPRIPDVRLAE